MAGTTYQAAVEINAQFTGQAAVDQARKSLDGINSSIKNVLTGLKAFAIALVTREALEFGKRVIDLGENIGRLSQKTGIGAQALSDLRAAAQNGGVDFEELGTSLVKFSVNLQKAQAGAKESQRAFDALGVSVKNSDGSYKKTGDVILEVADAFKAAKDGPEKAAVAVALFGRAGADLIPVLDKGKEAIKNVGARISDDFIKQATEFSDNMKEMARQAEGFAATMLEKVLPTVNKVLESINKTTPTQSKSNWEAALEAAMGGGGELAGSSPVVQKQIEAEKKEQPGSKTEEIDKGTKKIQFNTVEQQKAIDALREKINLMNEETKILGLSSQERERAIVLQKLESQGVKQTNKDYEKLADAYKKAQEAQQAANAGLKGFGLGAKQAFQQYVEDANNAAQASKKLFGLALQGLEDAIVNFVKTGKLSFADLSATIENELLHLAVRKGIALAISAAFADGGVMTKDGPVPLKKYASGGIANSPQMAMFGEGSKPEAYVPLPDGRSIPVSMSGGKGGGNNSVVVNVNVNRSGADEDSKSNTDRGKQLGKVISAAVTQQLIREKRPGGLLS